MNYYQPREKSDKDGNPTGIWHYTRMNDGHIRPVGYCAQDCPGHDTKEGAYEHQRQYQLDTAKYDAGTISKALHECDVKGCTNYSGVVTRTEDQSQFTLCDEHRNREGLEKVLEIGDSISSW